MEDIQEEIRQLSIQIAQAKMRAQVKSLASRGTVNLGIRKLKKRRAELRDHIKYLKRKYVKPGESI